MSDHVEDELQQLRARVRELETTVAEQAARLDAAALTEAEFKSFFDHAPIKIAFKDAEGRYLYVNRRAEIDNGYRLEDIRGKFPHEVHYDALAKQIRKHDLGVLRTGRGSSQEVDLVRSGQAVTMLNARFPIRDAAGRLRGLGVVVFDITDRRRMEQKLRELTEALQAQLADGTAELQSVQQALLRSERLAVIGELTGTVSHELRNPLGTISASTHALRARLDPLPPMVGPMLERLERATSRCIRIIDELFDHARSRPQEPEPTNLDRWIETLLEDTPIPPEVELVTSFTCRATLSLDRHQVHGALSNLIQNALDAMRTDAGSDPAGTLTLATRVLDGHAVIAVSDTGAGIEDADLEQIFKPLFSTKSFGVGLGLPLVSRVAEEHGGRVEVDSVRGQGSTLSLHLPLPPSSAA